MAKTKCHLTSQRSKYYICIIYLQHLFSFFRKYIYLLDHHLPQIVGMGQLRIELIELVTSHRC